MESLEVTARTVSDAIAKALARLGKRRDEVEISVLSEGSRGILGIGGEDARILVSPKEATPVVESPAVTEPTRQPIAAADAAEIGIEILDSLLAGMGIDSEIESLPLSSDATENGFVAHLNVVGDDLGVLIGRRGETLGALQFVTNMILSRRTHRGIKVQVDVEGYRIRREETLRSLALRMAARVQETGLPLTLEAMPPNERRIVHLTLGENPAVTTASHGEGDQRRVVISPRR